MATTVLIISNKNEIRSQMLHGWLNYYGKEDIDVKSAGLEAGKLNMITAKAMMEAVIDITKLNANRIDEYNDMNPDHVIVLSQDAETKAKELFDGSDIHANFIELPNFEGMNELEILKKHRELVVQLEDYAMQFVHENVRRLI